MLDKNGLPLQFPPSAFSAFSGLHAGLDPRTAGWPSHPAFSAAAAAAAAQTPTGLPPVSGGGASSFGTTQTSGTAPESLLGLPHPALSPSFLSPSGGSIRHQDYLNAAAQRLSEMQASAALDPINAMEASRRASRKRAISASPYSEMDLSTLIRYSPTALHLLNGGSPTSSGSYGHLSPGALSPALVHSAHLQQLQAHLIRSASTSPFLSPQNSLQASLLHSSAAAAAAVSAASAAYSASPYFPFLNPPTGCDPKTLEGAKEAKPECSNVVSSTMEDDGDSSSREGLTPLTTVKHEPLDQMTNNHHSSSHSTKRMTSSDGIIKDEPDFVETHCRWLGCDRELHTQEQLVKHLNNDHIGNSKKAFVCMWKDCSREEKPFKAQYMLVVHMRRHTGEKPHRCTFENCAKAYSRLENLKTHLRSHTGEKPYTCEFPGCSKAFSNASDRAKHQNRTHSNEKPYACKAPGCTKRYTDPSSLRKHVKTVHGHEFYASKRHKGNNYDTPKGNSMDGSHPNTPRTPHSVSTVKSEVESSPGPISPPDERHNISSGSGNSSAGGGGGSGAPMMATNMPLSDNNVSTTNMAMVNTAWDMPDSEQDINMAVAAAIGVGPEDPMSGGGASGPVGQRGLPATGNNALSQRLSNKMKLMPNHPAAALGEINRSIEKMSIGSNYATSGGAPPQCTGIVGAATTNPHCGIPMTQTSVPLSTNNTRRGSNWTNSTEGYGSMRSEQSMMNSRRCSDVSAMSQGSNVSTRAMMNSPWDPMSADSSRRSSMASNHGGGVAVAEACTPQQAGIGQHLNRLHRRAQQQQQMMPTAAGGPPTSATPTMNMGRRASDMSAMANQTSNNNPPAGVPQPNMPHQNSSVRRASDPVRTLDQNFGVDGQISRHHRSGSYTQINMGHQQRVPIHGQRIRGMSGDTFFHQQQARTNNPSMYPPPQRMTGIIPAATGNGSFPTPNQGSNQFPPAYNSQMPNYPGWNHNQCQPQQQPATAAAAGQQTGQQGYNPQQPNFIPASYAGGAQRAGAVGNNNFEYNNGQWQGSSSNQQQQQWNNGWNNSGSSPQEIAAKCPPPAGNNAGTNTATPTVASASVASCDNSGNNYQRTFDYVQQCQTWTAQ